MPEPPDSGICDPVSDMLPERAIGMAYFRLAVYVDPESAEVLYEHDFEGENLTMLVGAIEMAKHDLMSEADDGDEADA